MTFSCGGMVVAGCVAAVVLTGAVWVVTLRYLFRAALSLGLVLLGVAGLFILLEAEFLAFVQILVYVGAILTLVVFAIMLTARVQGPAGSAAAARQWPAAVASLALFALLTCVIAAIPAPTPTAVGGAPVSLQELGRELVTTLVLPFEVISVVFVAAMVGAIAIASTNVHSPRSTVHSDGK